jgi:hypothetical protein
MFNSEWLDIAIGVLLVWFMLAVVVSALNEGIVQILGLRPKQLWRVLAQLVDGTELPAGLMRNLAGLPAWPGRPSDPYPGGGAPMVYKLYATKAIQSLENRTKPDQRTRIHNIPTAVFSQAVLELAMSAEGARPIDKVQNYVDGLGDIPHGRQLKTLLATAGDDIGKFQAAVERSFDGQMTRLSAIYRTQVRIALVVIGIAVSVAGFGLGLRSDALRLVSDLQHDQNLRTLVVGAATEAAKADLAKAGGCDATNAPNSAVCELAGAARLKRIDLAFHPADTGPGPKASAAKRLGFLMPWRHWPATLGVLTTGIAISFGSSFWYRILQRLVGLRGGQSPS